MIIIKFVITNNFLTMYLCMCTSTKDFIRTQIASQILLLNSLSLFSYHIFSFQEFPPSQFDLLPKLWSTYLLLHHFLMIFFSWDAYFRGGTYAAPPSLGDSTRPNEVPLSSLGGIFSNSIKLMLERQKSTLY